MLFLVCYGIGALSFLALIALMLLRRQPRSFGLGVLIACAATLLWAIAAAAQTWWLPGVAHALESGRSAAWLLIGASILAAGRKRDGRESGSNLWILLVASAVGIASVANDLRFVFSTPSGVTFEASQVLARLGVAVFGILIVENLARNTTAGRRWHIFPLCIAIGTIFAYDLFVFCEAIVLKRVDPSLMAGQGIILAFSVPLLVLTMARNPEWDIDVHISRGAVFHGVTLSAAGIFLLAAAGVASLLGRLNGQWAAVSELAFFCGSVVLLLTVLSTESLRSRVRRVIVENFFSMRYDYRAEWLRSIATLSSTDAREPLAARAIRAISDVVDSPGGVLWMRNDVGDFSVIHRLNMNIDVSAVETGSGDFVAGFRGGKVVQLLSDRSSRKSVGYPPVWASGTAAWMAVPLFKVDDLIGFVLIAHPRAPATPNWESFELLLTIGQQVAGYLAEDKAMRTLLESQTLIDYSKNFAFVIHDIKNVAGQLGMMIANVPKYGAQAEFRSDMVRGMEGSVKKLHDLIDRLRPGSPSTEISQSADPAQIVREIVGEFGNGEVGVCAEISDGSVRVGIAPSTLHSILTHLVRNAVEASERDGSVVIRLDSQAHKTCIEVIDTGCGMSPEFIRSGLFEPLLTTKQRGHGIGAFQARELVRAAGGDLQVTSVVGRGTTMRVLLPETVSEDGDAQLVKTAAQ